MYIRSNLGQTAGDAALITQSIAGFLTPLVGIIGNAAVKKDEASASNANAILAQILAQQQAKPVQSDNTNSFVLMGMAGIVVLLLGFVFTYGTAKKKSV